MRDLIIPLLLIALGFLFCCFGIYNRKNHKENILGFYFSLNKEERAKYDLIYISKTYGLFQIIAGMIILLMGLIYLIFNLPNTFLYLTITLFLLANLFIEPIIQNKSRIKAGGSIWRNVIRLQLEFLQ